ncbi:rhodanese-like domain-containing protein [Candidatus Bipolaricaulota bacterium]
MITRSAGTIALMLVLGLAAVAAPEITVDADTYDFGTILEGFAVEHTFVLTNVGDETLTIETVRATCGCTTTKLATDVLEPGESVELRAVVGTTGFGGQTISKQIYVYSNDPRFAEDDGPDRLVLRITGTVLRAEAYHITNEDLYYISILLIDLRSEEAFATGHLIGALNLPAEDLLDSAASLPKGNVIVLYDATGTLSNSIIEGLIGTGLPLARTLSGGLAAWVQAYGAQYLYPEPADLDYGEPVAATLTGTWIDPTPLESAFSILVDLRSAEAFGAGHLIGATNLPLETVSDKGFVTDLALLLGDLPKEATIIVYDQDGAKSDDVAQLLIAAGYRNAKSLLGGLDEWAHIYGDQLIWADDS